MSYPSTTVPPTGELHHPRAYEVIAGSVLAARRKRIWTDLVAAAAVLPGDDVLDIGCGTGYFASRLAPAVLPGGSITGIDPAASMIEACRRDAADHVRFEIGVAERLPYDDYTFDLVVCTLALHHVSPDERAGAITEMFHVLRPGGRLLIADIRLPRNGLLRRVLSGRGDGLLPIDPAEVLRSQVVDAGFTITGTGEHPFMHHIAATRPGTSAGASSFGAGSFGAGS